MPALVWSTFGTLPGAATTNFEMLCRGIIRCHYSQFGTFRALANQPGVEFHLRLTNACDLGAPPQWFGWQCKWYDVENGENIGAARRQQIKESVEKTEKHLPGITDWILWTRHILTKSDQEWFYALSTGMKLHLWSGIDVDDRLTGPAAILRETYFGQLVLTPESLKALHDQAVAPIRQRWLPEVHQVVDAEREVHRTLGEIEAWSILSDIQKELDDDIEGIDANLGSVPAPFNADLQKVIDRGRDASAALAEAYDLLSRGRYETLIEAAIEDFKPSKSEQRLLRQLRSGRFQPALYVTNLLADMTRAQRMMSELRGALEQRLVIVVADAGCGKTQMSAQLTAATTQRSAGLLLRGKQLGSGQGLNELAQKTTIRGTRVESFESLIAAVAVEIKDSQVSGAEYAMGMDFQNYTLGRLVKGRSSYDFENASYKEMRRQIEYRIVNLGYSSARFKSIDNMIGSDRHYAANRDKGKTDRYGKKYAWIAFFEMYGLQFDKGELQDHCESRPSDVDIDPSFPEAEKVFQPNLADIFGSAPTALREWLANGPTPDYSGYLQPAEIDGVPGPWVLLQGFIEEAAKTDSRRVFSFLRGIVVNRSSVSRVLKIFSSIEYPGNHAIPDPMEDHYTFAGEISWSQQFAGGLRDASGNAVRDTREAFDYHDGKEWVKGIEIEVPVCRFAWESYHSELNQVSGVHVPAPSLLKSLGLSNRKGEWDFYDPSGRIATLYREFEESDETIRSHLCARRLNGRVPW